MINKLIWDFRYCILRLLLYVRKHYHRIPAIVTEVLNVRFVRTRRHYHRIRHAIYSSVRKYIANDKISTSNKQQDLSQPTKIISSRKKISVYFHGSPHLIIRLSWCTTPFKKWLLDKGCEVTSNPHEANIIIIDHDDQINNPEWQNKKKFLVTKEPYGSLIKKPVTYINGQPLLVSNCHVNSLLTSNYAVYPFTRMHKKFPDLFTIAKLHFSDIKHNWHRRNKVATMMVRYATSGTYYQPSSLIPLRQSIALYGRAAGITDIKGRGWPSGIVSKEKINYPEDKPFTDTREKITWLRQGYLFNLCFENSNIPYYVTEKIWQALVGCTLPIYYSNDTIYETFPKGSFIDYRDFKNKAQLYQYILDMPADEYLDRLNLGIEFVSRYREHIAEFKRWQKTARQHIYDDLVRLHEIKGDASL